MIGAISELVAVWMTSLNIDRIMELVFSSSSCQYDQSIDVEMGQEAITQGIQNKIIEMKGNCMLVVRFCNTLSFLLLKI